MRVRHTVLSIMSAAVVVTAGVLAVPAVAQAAPSTIAREQARGSHCVVALSAGTAAKRSVVKDYRCFTTLSQAVAYASGGEVKLGARSSLSSADSALRRRSSASSAPVLGIEYNEDNFGGTSLTLTGSGGSGCYGGTEYSFANLGTYGWNDKIESARSYSNCVAVHYKNSGLSGASASVFGSKGDFGSLSNEISSIRFF
jgi:hypothetical protein